MKARGSHSVIIGIEASGGGIGKLSLRICFKLRSQVGDGMVVYSRILVMDVD